MSLADILHFNSQLGKQKMESIVTMDNKCPFCDRANLQEIIAEQGPLILVKNKYPVLKDTYQTVLIETDNCDSELSTYPKEHLHNLIRFGVENWLKMEDSGEFTSVVFFKNHGPYSGGTILHPHMQIIGLKHVDYRKNVQPRHFEGKTIHNQHAVEFNISTQPLVGFFEFNIIISELDNLAQMADYMQTAVHYVLHHLHKNSSSYNLFFYHLGPRIMVKVIPRFITSPLFIGYNIPQVSDRMEAVIKDIQEKYF